MEKHLEKMFLNLHGVLEKEYISGLKEKFCQELTESTFENIAISLIKLVNKLSISIQTPNEKNGGVVYKLNIIAKSQIETKVMNDQKQRSCLDSLPDDMLKAACNYLPAHRDFFWKYGVVNKNILSHVTNILSEQNLLVEFHKEKSMYKQNLQLINTSPLIATSIEKLGASIPLNNCLTKDDMVSFSSRCSNLRVLQLWKSNVSLFLIEVITLNFKKLTHFEAGNCKYIHKEMIDMLIQNCKFLEVLQIPVCTNLNFNTPGHGTIISSILGDAINGYEIDHNPGSCNKMFFNIYRIGTYIGVKHFDGNLQLSSLIKVIRKSL